jgi:hypothetical protein
LGVVSGALVRKKRSPYGLWRRRPLNIETARKPATMTWAASPSGSDVIAEQPEDPWAPADPPGLEPPFDPAPLDPLTPLEVLAPPQLQTGHAGALTDWVT